MGTLSIGVAKFYNDGMVQAVTFGYLIYRCISYSSIQASVGNAILSHFPNQRISGFGCPNPKLNPRIFWRMFNVYLLFSISVGLATIVAMPASYS